MSKQKNDKFQEEGINFLKNDFNQCVEQAKYYDGQIVDIFKFLSTFYTTVAGIAIGLYQFSLGNEGKRGGKRGGNEGGGNEGKRGGKRGGNEGQRPFFYLDLQQKDLL